MKTFKQHIIESLLHEDVTDDLDPESIPQNEYPPNGGGGWFLSPGGYFYWVVNDNGTLQIGDPISPSSPDSPTNISNYGRSVGSGWVRGPGFQYYDLGRRQVMKFRVPTTRFIRSLSTRDMFNIGLNVRNAFEPGYYYDPTLYGIPMIPAGVLNPWTEDPNIAYDIL
jgi:hypothetical protein